MQTTRVTRRKHSKEFRAEVVQACRQPSASVAAIALRSGLNANVVYRWLREDAGVDAAASSLAVMGGRLGRRVHCRAVAPAGGTTVHGHPPRDAPGGIHRYGELAAAGCWRMCCLAARLAEMIRIDAVWLATEPMDMRAGTDTALARVVKVFGAAHPH